MVRKHIFIFSAVLSVVVGGYLGISHAASGHQQKPEWVNEVKVNEPSNDVVAERYTPEPLLNLYASEEPPESQTPVDSSEPSIAPKETDVNGEKHDALDDEADDEDDNNDDGEDRQDDQGDDDGDDSEHERIEDQHHGHRHQHIEDRNDDDDHDDDHDD